MTADSYVRPAPGPGTLADGIGWDVANWSRAWHWCARTSSLTTGTALEVGADGDNGGLSLLLASRGWRTTCSGLQPPSDSKRELHERHGVTDLVTYARLDVLDPPQDTTYDLVVLKSTLGHVGQGQRFDLQRRAVRHLHAMVRPGGELWLLENAAGTRLHRLGRNHLGAGRTGWRYLTPDDLDVLLAPFPHRYRRSFGVAAAGGRTERQRTLLARLDSGVLDHVTPSAWRYVLAAVARRGEQR